MMWGDPALAEEMIANLGPGVDHRVLGGFNWPCRPATL